jgi:lactate dehydrogenase-like 2-hydroxyacid dehydrogenase
MTPRKRYVRALTPGATRYSRMELATSDLDCLHAISIHIHMTPENRHLFDRKTLARMKDSAVLVNTSRGDVINEDALIEALDSGKLSAFGGERRMS